LGDSHSPHVKRLCEEHRIGRMLTCHWPTLYDDEPWGFDNGAYDFFLKRQKDPSRPEFNEKKFLMRLKKAEEIKWKPYLAVLPDIVGAGNKSLELSMSWVGNLPDWNWYLAVQDGMDVDKVIEVIDKVAGIFLGGTSEYKQYAGYWCKISHHCGKKFHYARAGTIRKLWHAIMVGSDSLDSSTPLFTKTRLINFIKMSYIDPPKGLGLLNEVIFAPIPNRGRGALTQLDK